MFVELGLFVLGLALLVFGADRAVTSAGDLALFYGVSPFFIGVTLISVGTSVPEIVVAGIAAHEGRGGISVGSILGTRARLAAVSGCSMSASGANVRARWRLTRSRGW
ncbi:Sodium/calcium exchanger protein [Halopelagius inordinatus]|uniref:Sodium/calcium exchanger protein n=1 Tax=Halopelagius inordinatus TaxID=553467 RepID=A0A1I2VM25_9EURY|nr:hypothetical protein [Halopelagius inordinatus]SFG90338.1 Sodium/calcium exchanger protein [Halopelagius inordinatus]